MTYTIGDDVLFGDQPCVVFAMGVKDGTVILGERDDFTKEQTK